MHSRILQQAFIITLALALIGGGAWFGTSWLQVSPVSAQEPTPAMTRTITVVGLGVVDVEPNVARANIGVDVMRPSVEEASAENNRIVDTLLTTLKQLGVDEKDIQTSGFNVYAERYGFGGPVSEEEVQYRVSNSVMVIIRDLDKVSEVLDASIKAGANNIYGVEFLIEDATAARSEARKLAVESARANAEELAALTGVKVGKILSISEVIGGGGGFYNDSISAIQLGMGAGGAPPIQAGRLRLTMQLQVTYELVD